MGGRAGPVDTERIGLIGFCVSGRLALAHIAGGRPEVRAVAVNYGEVPKGPASFAVRVASLAPTVLRNRMIDRIVFGRRVSKRTPGRFHSKIFNRGVEPAIQVHYRASKVKQYFKEGRALRTETTVNDTRDFEADGYCRARA